MRQIDLIDTLLNLDLADVANGDVDRSKAVQILHRAAQHCTTRQDARRLGITFGSSGLDFTTDDCPFKGPLALSWDVGLLEALGEFPAERRSVAVHVMGALAIAGLLLGSLWYLPAEASSPAVKAPSSLVKAIKPFSCEVRRPCTDNDN